MLKFYNINNAPILDYPDIYFTPEYGRICEISDDCAKWELCVFKDLMCVYLKKNNEIITPYGYSGYFYSNINTFNEFLPIFKNIYPTQIIRQNPYINIELNNYEILKVKKVYIIETTQFDEYFNKYLGQKKRNMYTKAVKNNYKFELLENFNIFESFVHMYKKTMDRLNAEKYYYFNDKYFKLLQDLEYSRLCIVRNAQHKITGSCILLFYKNFIHYHLSCSDMSDNCIIDFMIMSIVKNYGINKTIVLGGGVNYGDGLCKFKNSLSTDFSEYKIFKVFV